MPLLGGCCSLDLKIGTKIIGIIFLILNLLCFLSVALLLVILLLMKEVIYKILDDAFNASIQSNSEQLDSNDYKDVDEKANDIMEFIHANRNLVEIVFLVILGQQLIDVACSSMLIHGIRKCRRGLLLPWAVTHILYIIVDLAILVFLVTLTISETGIYQVVLPVIAVDILWMALHIYFVLVVISQYQALGLLRMHDEMSMK